MEANGDASVIPGLPPLFLASQHDSLSNFDKFESKSRERDLSVDLTYSFCPPLSPPLSTVTNALNKACHQKCSQLSNPLSLGSSLCSNPLIQGYELCLKRRTSGLGNAKS